MNPNQPGGQPGVAAQQPPQQQQQQQQGVQSPSFSLGGGGRIGFNAGDMSAGNLVSAIVSGKGIAAPRKIALMMLGLGVAFLVGNFVLIYVLHLYYPYLLGLAPIFLLGGLFMLATDEPKARADGQNAPMWARAALGLAMLAGLAIGGVLCFVVSWGP